MATDHVQEREVVVIGAIWSLQLRADLIESKKGHRRQEHDERQGSAHLVRENEWERKDPTQVDDLEK